MPDSDVPRFRPGGVASDMAAGADSAIAARPPLPGALKLYLLLFIALAGISLFGLPFDSLSDLAFENFTLLLLLPIWAITTAFVVAGRSNRARWVLIILSFPLGLLLLRQGVKEYVTSDPSAEKSLRGSTLSAKLLSAFLVVLGLSALPALLALDVYLPKLGKDRRYLDEARRIVKEREADQLLQGYLSSFKYNHGRKRSRDSFWETLRDSRSVVVDFKATAPNGRVTYWLKQKNAMEGIAELPPRTRRANAVDVQREVVVQNEERCHVCHPADRSVLGTISISMRL